MAAARTRGSRAMLVRDEGREVEVADEEARERAHRGPPGDEEVAAGRGNEGSAGRGGPRRALFAWRRLVGDWHRGLAHLETPSIALGKG